MADNIIQVNVTANKPKSVTVSSAQVGTEITASSDTGRFWAQTSKNWAVSDAIVDNTDYSSKYYANKAKESATNANNTFTSIRETYQDFQDESNIVLNELNSGKAEGLEQIDVAKNNAINDINNTKTDIITDIEFVADGEKKEIEELIDSGKDELKEAIGDVKVLTTLEIGDIGFTQMAIDETKGKRRILNGQLIIQEQYVQFTNIIKESVALNPDLACTETEWQTEVTMNTFGLCDKFVIDDEAGTIRLPKYPSYFIGGVDNIAPVVGNGMTLGLEQGVSLSGLAKISNVGLSVRDGAYGVTNGTSISSSAESFENGISVGVTTDPEKSGLEAHLNDAELVKGTYFIQVATGAEIEDNIINEIELNNPFSLLDYKYSEYELNNISWLRSNGQYNSKAVYPAVYDLLLKIYNGTETKAGVSVKLSTEAFTDYDFVLNTNEETFRLPIKVKLASGKAVVGNGMNLGLTNGTDNAGLYCPNGMTDIQVGINMYGQPVGYSAAGQNITKFASMGVTTDPTKSGIETSDSDLYLYFYVGETVQNANLINAGRIEETLVKKVDMQQATIASFPSDRYIDLTLGASGTTYTAPANGYVVISKRASANNQSVEINIPSTGLELRCTATTSGGDALTSLVVKKGQIYKVNYNAGGTTNYFRFIYAEGEQ